MMFTCSMCLYFRATKLRALLNHLYGVHSLEPNFNVTCQVRDCRVPFRKYNSLYRHVCRHHGDIYNAAEDTNDLNHIDDAPNHEVQHDLVIVTNATSIDPIEGDDFILDNSDVDDDGVFDEDNINNEKSSSSEEDSSTDYDSDTNNELTSNNTYDDNEHINLQKTSASFILQVKERNRISQVAMNSIIQSTQFLVSQVMESTKAKVIKELEKNHYNNVPQISTIFDNSDGIFEGLETEPLQKSYIKKNFYFVDFRQVPLGKKIVTKSIGNKRILFEKEDCFFYIPLIESLKQLLSNTRIRDIIIKDPHICENGIYYDLCDGSLFKRDEYFQTHKKALILILYHDELEICNPLGNKAGVHKLDMFYYTLGNLSPKYRSKHCAVKLLAIAKAKFVREYGIDKIMGAIIEDIRALYNGVNTGDISHPQLFGKVICCTGDTLGQHLWGGFKEGVGASFQKCRTCYCGFEDMQEKFSEDMFTLRSKENYERECTLIEDAPTASCKSNLQTTYGINVRTVLHEIPAFDVTKQLPQDIMHTLLEGTVQYELRLVLLHYIKGGTFTLEELNTRISNLDYGYTEISDRPIPLRSTVFFGDERYKLKYCAAQARIFLRLITFFIADLVDVSDAHYEFILEIMEIVNIAFAPVVKDKSLDHFGILIARHLVNFKNLFPDKNILPKQHYTIHFPEMIKQLGPLIRYSCFAFESAHQYFKSLAEKQNFKNIAMSLAKRYQYLDCVNFGDPESVTSHPLFSSERELGVLKKQSLENVDIFRKKLTEQGLLPGIRLENVYSLSWIILFGTKYKKGGIVAVAVDVLRRLPIFGKIISVWYVHDFVYFQVDRYKTIEFSATYQAYHVTVIDETGLTPVEQLLDTNVFHVKFDTNNNMYVPVKYYLNDLMEEYLDENPMNY